MTSILQPNFRKPDLDGWRSGGFVFLTGKRLAGGCESDNVITDIASVEAHSRRYST